LVRLSRKAAMFASVLRIRPLGTSTSNLRLVEEAVRMVRDHGVEPATVAHMRRAIDSIADTA
jgi:uncharacterized protein (DUF849 family)